MTGSVLLIAAHHRCAFEWFAHAPAASRAGITDEALAALHKGDVPAPQPDLDELALAVVQSLLSRGNVTDESYHTAIARLGERTLAELVWFVGYYSMLALALAVFDPPNPDHPGEVF